MQLWWWMHTMEGIELLFIFLSSPLVSVSDSFKTEQVSLEGWRQCWWVGAYVVVEPKWLKPYVSANQLNSCDWNGGPLSLTTSTGT